MLFKFFVCPQKYNKSKEREKDKNTPKYVVSLKGYDIYDALERKYWAMYMLAKQKYFYENI